MQEQKDLVQEALIQMKNVEEAIAKNAQGILQSTMKEEISQLVEESLSEQDEMGVEADLETMPKSVDDVPVDDLPVDDDSDDQVDMDLDIDMEDDTDAPIDLTQSSDEEILRVFKAMGQEDGIIVKKDGEDVHLKDNSADVEYLIKLSESRKRKINETMENMDEMDEMDKMDEMDYESDPDTQKVIDAIFGGESSSDMGDDTSEVMYEIEFDEDQDESVDEKMMDETEYDESDDMMEDTDEDLDESDDMMEDTDEDLDESDNMMEDTDEELDEENWEESLEEAYSHKKAKRFETKESKSVKPKGVGLGSGPKFSYKKTSGGFKEDKKEGPKSVGTGKARFDYKKGENMEGKPKVIKKAETKEAARTYGMGSKEGRGLRKGITNNRNYVYGNGVKVESLESEVKILRDKNEEYRKALNVFREKLNEVAVFNSNLAYATRLFTEHSTTKKEKINILRRFDDVDSLKESKFLYKSIKDELSKVDSKPLNESVERKINKTVSSGSAVNLIESKTYENPQFLRMKDLMSKLK